MSSINNSLPKIQTILQNENRLFDCSFYETIDNAFEALQAFIIDSYSLNSNEQFSIQYEDDDKDYVTVSSIEDFKEAIEEANSNGEILKIYVVLQKNDSGPKNLNTNELQQDEQMIINDNEKEKITKNENDKNDINKILDDLRNNKTFREELISFIKTALTLFQQNHLNPDYDIGTCILTALSSHDTLMQHDTLQQYIMNLLPLITTRIQPFSAFLLNIDSNTAGLWLNQMIERWTNNSQPPTFSPFHQMISNILQPSTNQSTTGEKDKEQKQSSSDQTQPVISSSITDQFSYPKQYDHNDDNNNNNNNNNNHNYHNPSHPIAPPFNIGTLLSTLLTPPINNSNSNNNQQHHLHSLFNPQLWNQNQWHHHNHIPDSNSNSMSFNDTNKNLNNEPSTSVSHAVSSFDEDFKLCVVQDDSTLCDEAVVLPNQTLIKTWRVKNIGKKEIKNDLCIKYVGNVFNPMINGANFPILIDNHVLSIDQETDVIVTIESPIQNGHYSSEWKIFNGDGKSFDLPLTINFNVCSDNTMTDLKSNENNQTILNKKNENENVDQNELKQEKGNEQNELQNNVQQKNELNEQNHSQQNKNQNQNQNNELETKKVNEHENEIENENHENENENHENQNNENQNHENQKENKNKNEANHNQQENIDPYAKQIQLLLEMGFTNVDMLRSLLDSHNGLVDDVVNLLS